MSDLSPPHARLLKCLYRERAAISLFDDLNASDTGSNALLFSDAVIRQVGQTLSRFHSIALSYGVPPEHMSVFATEAMRRSANAAAMLDAIKEAAPGLPVLILAPEVETLFGAMGARSSFVDVKGLFLDLGGGSVQMTYMDSTPGAISDYEMVAAITGQSMPFGAARLIKIVGGGGDAKLMSSTKKELQTSMLGAFAKLCARFPDLAKAARADKKDAQNPGVDVYLCGGGFRGYGSMLMHNDAIRPYPIPLIDSYTVTGDYFKETKKMLQVNTAYKGKIFGMSKRRREHVPAIVTVVEGLIDAVPRINTVTFCGGGNREGALMMKLPRELREANPIVLLGTPSSNSPVADPGVVQAVVDALQSAIPATVVQHTAFPLVLSPVLAQRMWERCGDGDGANASWALHDSISRDPGAPGLNHLARASLAIALLARWGGGLPPPDVELYENLRVLLGEPESEGTFWAEYTGATAATLTTVFPAGLKSAAELREGIR